MELICLRMDPLSLDQLYLVSRELSSILAPNSHFWERLISERYVTGYDRFLYFQEGQNYKKKYNDIIALERRDIFSRDLTKENIMLELIIKGREPSFFYAAISFDNLGMIKYLDKKENLGLKHLKYAIGKDNFQIFKYIFKRTTNNFTDRYLDFRDQIYGNINLVNYLFTGSNMDMIKYAASKGYLPENNGKWKNFEVTKYLWDEHKLIPGVDYLETQLNSKISNGNLKQAIYLFEMIKTLKIEVNISYHKKSEFSLKFSIYTDSLKEAVNNGHMDIIKYFGDLGYLPLMDAVTIAIEKNYSDIVKYLITKGLYPEFNTILNSARRGNVDIAKTALDEINSILIKTIKEVEKQ